MEHKSDILIIGIGNPYRHDDGVGFFVIDLLEKKGLDAETRRVKPDGYSLLEAWKERDFVVIVDAARGMGAAGTIRWFDALDDEIQAELSPVSTHSLSLPETLFMGNILDQLPNTLWVCAVEAGDLGHGTDLTPAVKKAGRRVASQIEKRVREYADGALNADTAQSLTFRSE